ncbi:hypothetical protein ACFQ4L_03550 [Lapidilactobacillus mulanensis]|uniref:Uncharacterized protein n=1 Tax=Lapidilactobacillus mulanensis TaxID=2485999 RepID=A0ABW4DMV5_9LACO
MGADFLFGSGEICGGNWETAVAWLKYFVKRLTRFNLRLGGFFVVPAKFVVGTGKLLWGRLQDFPKYGKFFRLKSELLKTAGSHISPFCKFAKTAH